MSSEEGDSCQVRLKAPRLFQGYLTFSKQLTSFMFLVRTLSGNHPQSTDSGTSRSPMVPWLAHLREEAAERQCPHQLPTARCQAVGGTFPVSRSYLLVRSLLPRRCPRVVLSATHKRRKTAGSKAGHPSLFSHFTLPVLPVSLLNEARGLDNSQGTSQLCRQHVLAL